MESVVTIGGSSVAHYRLSTDRNDLVELQNLVSCPLLQTANTFLLHHTIRKTQVCEAHLQVNENRSLDEAAHQHQGGLDL